MVIVEEVVVVEEATLVVPVTDGNELTGEVILVAVSGISISSADGAVSCGDSLCSGCYASSGSAGIFSDGMMVLLLSLLFCHCYCCW